MNAHVVNGSKSMPQPRSLQSIASYTRRAVRRIDTGHARNYAADVAITIFNGARQWGCVTEDG
jgi:hypothetical protein